MKTQKMNIGMAILVAGLAVATISACSKENTDRYQEDNTYTLSGDASGSQVAPALTVAGTGALNGTYNTGTNTMNYTIDWATLTGLATGVHFHGPAQTGENADAIIILSITNNGIGGTASGSIVLSPQAESYLMQGKLYYNIRTAAHPMGEIRGQVSVADTN